VRIGMRTIKTVISALLAMLAASELSLLYWPSAGIIAVLSVGNTRRSSLMVGVYRLAAFVLATIAAFISFSLAGYTTLGFGLFLLLFIPIAAQLKLSEGIVVNSVLVTHYLSAQTMTWPLIGNEAALMMLGVGFALLANIYMPDKRKQLLKNQEIIEEKFRDILQEMAFALSTEKKGTIRGHCEELLIYVRKSQLDARNYQENYWLKHNVYYETYFSMRRAQINVLKNMLGNLQRIKEPGLYGKYISELLTFTAETFEEANDGSAILERINEVYQRYREMPLPVHREEFEDRAELFQFLQSFKSFIEIKAEFAQVHSEKRL
jgi:uncharacterized membrane protein YgaE (UPF0421/DUF939 family)